MSRQYLRAAVTYGQNSLRPRHDDAGVAGCLDAKYGSTVTPVPGLIAEFGCRIKRLSAIFRRISRPVPDAWHMLQDRHGGQDRNPDFRRWQRKPESRQGEWVRNRTLRVRRQSLSFLIRPFATHRFRHRGTGQLSRCTAKPPSRRVSLRFPTSIRCPKGRPYWSGRARHLQQPQPADRSKGSRLTGYPWLRHRRPDDARL